MDCWVTTYYFKYIYLQNKQIICVWSAWIFDNDAMNYIQDGQFYTKTTILYNAVISSLYIDIQLLILV